MSSLNSKYFWSEIEGRRLVLIRKQLKLSRSKAGKMLGVSGESWRRWEEGLSEPGIGKLKKLIKKGFSLNWILMGEGSPRLKLSTSLFVAENTSVYGKKIPPEEEKIAEIRAYVDDVSQNSPRAKRLFIMQFLKCFEEDFMSWSKTRSRATKKTESEEE